MSTSKALSWNDRFALIDKYQPSDEQACNVFQVTQEELDAARTMRDSGTMMSATNIDVDAYHSWFESNDDKTSTSTTHGSSNTSKGKSTKTSTPKDGSGDKSSAQSATKKQRSTSTSTKSPGRRGSKIAQAFGSLSSEAVDAEEFANTHGVSIAVLRQSKRFDKYPEQGKVRVEKDKQAGKLKIWREDPSSSK